jgi:hypothetical protein
MLEIKMILEMLIRVLALFKANEDGRVIHQLSTTQSSHQRKISESSTDKCLMACSHTDPGAAFFLGYQK